MGRDLWDSCDRVKDLFQRASEVTAMNLVKLLFEGTEEELKATDKTQLAVTLVNIAAREVLDELGVEAAGCAGFSLGEYSALYDAGVLELDDLFTVVKARGKLMEKASRHLDSEQGHPGMAAVLGLPADEALAVLATCREAGQEIYLANHSSPMQIVLAGTTEGLESARERFEEAGAIRYIILRVSGPFHSPLMEEARADLAEALAAYTFKDPIKSVYANVTGKRIQTGQEAKDLCVKQVVTTVRWVDSEQSILDDGYERILEVGPGRVLSGLWKSFHKPMRCKTAGTLEDIETLNQE